jgi:hypothetical protein
VHLEFVWKTLKVSVVLRREQAPSMLDALSPGGGLLRLDRTFVTSWTDLCGRRRGKGGYSTLALERTPDGRAQLTAARGTRRLSVLLNAACVEGLRLAIADVLARPTEYVEHLRVAWNGQEGNRHAAATDLTERSQDAERRAP